MNDRRACCDITLYDFYADFVEIIMSEGQKQVDRNIAVEHAESRADTAKPKPVTTPLEKPLPMASFFKSVAASATAGALTLYSQSPWFEKTVSELPAASASQIRLMAYVGVALATGIAAVHAYDVFTQHKTSKNRGATIPRCEP